MTPSLSNLKMTIGNFKILFKMLKKIGFTYLFPRTFNQDPLENFFGKIRQRGHRNINPTVFDFQSYYKSLLVGLSSKQSVGNNCEDDQSELFFTLQRLISQGLPEDDEVVALPQFTQIPANLPTPLKLTEERALRYVAGYLGKKIGKESCDCKKQFFKIDQKEEEVEDFLKYKEYPQNSQKRLKYVSNAFLSKIRHLAILKYMFKNDFHKPGVLKYALQTLAKIVMLTPCFHDDNMKRHIFSYLLKIQAHNYCTQINNVKGFRYETYPCTCVKNVYFCEKN